MKRICLVLENLRQRGQALVELAFTLPLFLMMFFCIVYGGWVFTDYMTFSNIARDCTHTAVYIQSDDLGAAVRQYATDNNLKNALRSDVFVWNPNSSEYLDAEEKEEDGSITVTVHLKAGMDTSKSYLGKVSHNLMSLVFDSKKVETMMKEIITIDYSMYKEKDDENTSK